ncbi:hypothetical protein ELS19_17190 [Halogeometricum borinquense]|uniref:Uncharacterized protein n=1 Tax=Halogeometricum borinquense TaxID=60847 RepID=A0A482T0W7_9EURY|nr:hypothetical protein [Halogeometricum borinquense]RYJ08290.1 hypothetical protein ELS19_17190 [Halogeometricum borinquense]
MGGRERWRSLADGRGGVRGHWCLRAGPRRHGRWQTRRLAASDARTGRRPSMAAGDRTEVSADA